MPRKWGASKGMLRSPMGRTSRSDRQRPAARLIPGPSHPIRTRAHTKAVSPTPKTGKSWVLALDSGPGQGFRFMLSARTVSTGRAELFFGHSSPSASARVFRVGEHLLCCGFLRPPKILRPLGGFNASFGCIDVEGCGFGLKGGRIVNYWSGSGLIGGSLWI